MALGSRPHHLDRRTPLPIRRPRAYRLGWLAIAALVLACGGASTKPSDPQEAAPADATSALIDQARAAESRREYLEAQALYQRAKEAAPDDARRAFAARTYGRALIFYGEYQRALAELSEAAHLQADDAGTWHDLGILAHRLGDHARAEQAFQRAIELVPKDPRPRIALAALLVVDKRYTEAIAAYRALLAMDPPEVMRARIEEAIDLLEREGAATTP